MRPTVPSTASVLGTLVGVTWRRLLRGRALWVSAGIALLPVLLGAAVKGRHEVIDVVSLAQLLVMAVLPPIFIAASIGEELEDRTSTYLWSRPLPRWTMIVGKLLALAPIAMVLIAIGWSVAVFAGTGEPPTARSTVAYAAGTLAIATVSAGIATLVPRHGMALSIVYLVILDLAIGAIPASLQTISITHQVGLLSGLDQTSAIGEPAITMTAIAAVWLAIGLWRLRRLES